ncbi:hypothetical protein HK104_006008, partial [Borealophlyctis nickersoniae]
MPDFTSLTELASSAVGGRILFATDDFFAPAEALLSDADPLWDERKFTDFGKWMDGWETRRKRAPGHDWAIIQLGLPGTIAGFDIDTAYFTGNQAPRVSIQAAWISNDSPLYLTRRSELGSAPTSDELAAAQKVGSDTWTEILPMTPLRPGYPDTRHHSFAALHPDRKWTHLRLNLYPDGGVARLRVYGIVSRDWSNVSKTDIVDLAAVENGGRAISCSDSHYGKPSNLIAPGRALTMAGGWET